MATFDVGAVGTVVFAATSITSASMTIAATSNRAGVLNLYHSGNSATGITSSLAGTSGSAVSGTDTTTARTHRTLQHVVIAPASGSQTGSCSWTGANDAYLVVAVYNDCDQTTPAINGTFSSGATGAPSLTPTAGAGSASVVCMAAGSAAGETQTIIGSSLTGTSQDFEATRGTAGATHSWNDSFSAWTASGCCLQSPSNKVLDGTGTQLTATGGEAGLFRSLISGDFFVGKFFQGGFFSAAAGNPSLTATGTQLTLSGGTATLRANRILVGTGTQLTASGGTATLRKDFRLTATGTLLTLSGGTAGFNFTRGMSGTGTALALSGGTAALRADRVLVGTGTQLTLSGGTATLRADRILAGTGGVLLLTGGDATMNAGGDKTLDATGSALALSGGTASLRVDRVLSGEASILSLFGGDATLEIGAGTPAVTGPTPAGGVTSSKRKKRKVLIGDDLYEVDNLRDVEFLLKRIVRNPEPVRKAVEPRKVVTERISTKADPAAPVAVPMASVEVDWSGLYAQLASQDAAYARMLVKVLEKQEEDDLESILLLL